MNLTGIRKGCLAFAIVALSACGDSTGSGEVSSEEALRSLNRGFGQGGALPFGLGVGSLGEAANLGQVNVTLDGNQESMYALGLRVTYPAGTCMETLFIIPGQPLVPGVCTPPPLGVALVLWQTRSGSRPPDRVIFLAADIGTSDFSFADTAPLDFTIFPAVGFLLDRGGERFWGAIGGTLTSQVTATTQTCEVTPPPFAASSTCHIATFDEAGSITFEEFDFESISSRTIELLIPRQNILGILQAVTAVRPVTLFPATALRGW